MTYTFKISIDDWANDIDVTPLYDDALSYIIQ